MSKAALLAKKFCSFLTIVLLIGSIFSALSFSFFGIDKRSMWHDEAYSVYLASHDFRNIIQGVKNAACPPLYIFLLAVWIRMFGIGEFAVRGFSTIFYIFSLPAIYMLGKTFYDKKTGLLCSFLYMLSPMAICHAQNARMYSLLGLLAILSTLFFLQIFLAKRKERRYLLFYVLTNIAGTFTHYWFPFVILAQIISYLSLLYSKETFKRFLAAIAISTIPFLVLWTPILLFQLTSGCVFGVPKAKIMQLRNIIFWFYPKKALLVIAVSLSLSAFKVEGLRMRFSNISKIKKFAVQKQNLVFLISLCVILLVPFIISQVIPCYLPRYGVTGLFAFIMLIGAFLGKFGKKFITLLCCCILLAMSLTFFFMHRNRPRKYSDELTAEYLIRHAGYNDIIVFNDIGSLTFDYYLRLMKPDKTFIQIFFPLETVAHPGWVDRRRMSDKDYIRQLESQAGSIVAYINGMLTKNAKTRIWVFSYVETEINKILKNKFDTHFSLEEEKDLKGSFYESIFVYQKRDRR